MLQSHVALLSPLMIIFAMQQAVQSANVLALINLASPSHYFFNRAVTRSLAARGHQVCPVYAFFGTFRILSFLLKRSLDFLVLFR
jgi:hypothetical protein